jgi:hypothetical protein
VATSPQRAYRAACPNCGAPVEFRSTASAGAICGFCRSTLVRDGEALRRIGSSAELFDDHSPLQLGVSGRYQGSAFTLVGRLQYGYTLGPQARLRRRPAQGRQVRPAEADRTSTAPGMNGTRCSTAARAVGCRRTTGPMSLPSTRR